MFFFFFKQKTAYEMRISDWSSDVCSSDLMAARIHAPPVDPPLNHRGSHRLAQLLGIQPARLGGAQGLLAARLVVQDEAVHQMGGTGEAIEAARPEARSGERRVGNECVSTCRSRLSPYH